MTVPRTHPRYESLRTREVLAKGLAKGLVVPEGLIAHGRGEAFDYLLGERTLPSTKLAITAAAAQLLLAKKPVISVNGNTAALVPREIASLANAVPAKVEINLFHRSRLRERTIGAYLTGNGVREVLGAGAARKVTLSGISSNRARVHQQGISSSDVVVIPLEDGDRASALRKLDKITIAVDLNPLSRTSRVSSVTVVDNILRALPSITLQVRNLRKKKHSTLRSMISQFDNEANLGRATREIASYLHKWS